MPLGTEVGLGRGHFVLDGDQPPSPKRGTAPSPIFSAHDCGDQTAGWFKVLLGTKVGLDPGNIVIDAVPAPSPRDTAPNFRPMSVVAKRLYALVYHFVRK